jgi:hypothetical protein
MHINRICGVMVSVLASGAMGVSEWVIVVERQSSNISAISWREQVNFQWDDDEVRFVLDQHAEYDFYIASSLSSNMDLPHPRRAR